jgi:glycerol-3-phosphate responsive antiterminator
MTESIPHTKYIVAYHITGNKDGLINAKEVIKRTKPKFIIIMPGLAPIPFMLTHYSERFNINNVLIYEIF